MPANENYTKLVICLIFQDKRYSIHNNNNEHIYIYIHVYSD
jgi:hypothetical protein